MIIPAPDISSWRVDMLPATDSRTDLHYLAL